MTEITVSAADAERTLIGLATCAEREGRLQTLKLMLQLAVILEGPRAVGEIQKGTEPR